MKQFVMEWTRAPSTDGRVGRVSASASGGAIAAAEGALHLVGDVRLDGREELRRRLAAAGRPVARNATDGAMIIASWLVWGDDAVSRLRGDFSFAIWDDTRPGVVCARDALGVRPLYYADLRDRFICSNVLEAVCARPGVSGRLHEPALASFLECGWNRDLTTTTFADVRRLAPAHQLRAGVEGRTTTVRQHWEFPVPAPLMYRHEAEYIEHYRAVLGEAVRDRATEPSLAIMLSGGLDSTSLAATVRGVAPEVDLIAFSQDVSQVVPSDDVRLARMVADRLQVRCELIDDIPLALEHLRDPALRTPEPLDEPEYSAWRRLMMRVRRVASGLLLGEDGDALLAPPSLLRTMRHWPFAGTLRRFVGHWATTGVRPHLGLNLRQRWQSLREPAWRPRVWIRDDLVGRCGDLREPDHGTHPTRPETHRFLMGTIWQSVHEVFSPAYSGSPVEMRWPLLDVRVLEFALAIPPVPWCQHKELTRRAFRDLLPAEVTRRPKAGLPGYELAQVARWRRESAGQAPALSAQTLELVDGDKVHRALREGSPEDVMAAWRVLALDRWLRHAA